MLPTGILISCTGPFRSGSLCLFGFCLLVSSVSHFCPDTGGQRWSLFRFACSVVLRGGGGAADKCRWPVWGALAVFRPHWVCPHSRVCAFPVYTAPPPSGSIGGRSCVACCSSFWVLHKSADSVGACVLCLPRPKQLRQPGA